MISIIDCGFGYVKNHQVGRIIFGAQDCDFENEYDALHDLAKGLYRKYKNENIKPEKRNICCKKTLESIKKAMYCASCGSDLIKNSFDFNKFERWIIGLMQKTCDTYGEEIYPYEQEEDDSLIQLSNSTCEWTPWLSTKDLFERGSESILVLQQEGEQFIIEALDENGIDKEDLESWKNRDKPWFIEKLSKKGLKHELSLKNDKNLDYHVKK